MGVFSKLRSFSLTVLLVAFCTTHTSASTVSGTLPGYGVTTDPSLASNQTFDYIVVGGGLAGMTVASRLSEDSSVTVLVVEVGADDRKNPAIYDMFQAPFVFGGEFDWAWTTDGARRISGGRTLGGSSSINGAAYTRTSKAQYDAISEFLEPEDQGLGWDFEGIQDYMKKSEHFHTPTPAQQSSGASYNPSYHGTSGPLHVAYPPGMFAGPQQPAFVNALVNATGTRLKNSSDLNGGEPNGVGITPLTLNPDDEGHRSSSAQAYLTPVEGERKNWLTLTTHMVTKLIFKDDTLPLVATGVEFAPINSTERYQAFARREVILAAGSIQTPALLQLSGIGDSVLLEPLGIKVILEHKTVGKNLQEQTLDMIAAQPTDFDTGGPGPQDAIALPNLYELFDSEETAKEAVAEMMKGVAEWAEALKENGAGAEALEEIFKIQAKLVADPTSPMFEMFFIDFQTAFGMSMWNLLPFSRGSVKINSTDPFTKPTINVNYFAIDFDMQIQIHGTRLARKVLKTAPLSELVVKETTPGDAVPDIDGSGGSDEDWRAWIMKDYVANCHPVATAAMMRRDLGGVVDARLKVYDTANLRVVDASVLPLQISAHLSATLYGVAEKAADLIKEDYA